MAVKINRPASCSSDILRSMQGYAFLFGCGMAIILASCGQAAPVDLETKKRPNIIVILADDLGYSDIGSFGGELSTPCLDSLAQNGFKMTQFYNAGRCCPTRASLLTGLYQHQAGVGFMDDPVRDASGNQLPAYQGYLNSNCVTIAEVLKESGYQTYLSGKWHIGREPAHWPSRRGFEESYAFIYGAGSYFNTKPYRPSNRPSVITLNDEITQPGTDFYLTSEISHRAIEFIKKAQHKPAPFFMYLSYTAPHWPLHALEEDIARFRGRYMGGWDSLRKTRFARMLEMGIVNESWGLSPRYTMPPDMKVTDSRGEKVHLTPGWDTLSLAQRREWDQKMAVYAAMVYRMDKGIGELVDQLKKQGALDNTLIMFMSDNGACHEPVHTWDIIYDQSGEVGSANSFDGYSYPWANASNTPFRLFKHWTAEGGISTPFIAHWPAGIKGPILNTTDYAHIIDIMATCVDIAQARYPAEYRGENILPMEGNSLLPLFDNVNLSVERPIFWEHQGNIAVRKGDWKLVKLAGGYVENEHEFQLFDLKADRTESNNLLPGYPEIGNALKEAYYQWADRVGVDSTLKW